jgi:adenylate cyclase
MLLLFSLGGLTVLVSVMTRADVRVTAEQYNIEMNKRSAIEALALLNRVHSAAAAFLAVLDVYGGGGRDALAGIPPQTAGSLGDVFFHQNPEIAAFNLGGYCFINNLFFENQNLEAEAYTPDRMANFFALREPSSQTGASGDVLENVSLEFGLPMAFLSFQDLGGRSAGAVFSVDGLSQAYGESLNKSVLLNTAGDVIVHYDPALTRVPLNMTKAVNLEDIVASPAGSTQVIHRDEQGARFFAAYTKLPEFASIILTTAEYDKVFEGAAATTRQNILLTGAVLLIAILFIWFFSKMITVPLQRLTAASAKISAGDYELTLPVKSRDEIGLLTESFVSMSRGLAERERLKTAFGRFTNRVVAERAVSGDLALGGETKTATIFFSDIRSFTALSEKLKPSEVVEFLNDYMTRMVACVEKTGGVVDKFIGDAIMGVWGAPVSTGSPDQDALACVQTALLMRSALAEFNKDRAAAKKARIHIGCGINTGDVVAGQIGSSNRMEYTVIGDAVNLASRTEALNKPLGTDILITGHTWNLLKDKLAVEEMPQVYVKGKRKPIRLFAVLRLLDDPEGPASLSHLRRLIGAAKPNMSAVNLNEPETKYKLPDV